VVVSESFYQVGEFRIFFEHVVIIVTADEEHHVVACIVFRLRSGNGIRIAE